MNPADLAQLEELVEKSAREPWRYGGALHRALRALLAEHAIAEGWQLVRQDVFNKLISTGTNFYAFVEGECPSLIEDDHNAYDFAFALAAAKETK
jgi:hypothetical protein